MFKVVADQLKVAQGWVRCGHCAEVFDASAHLLPDEAAELAPSAWTPDDEPAVQQAPWLQNAKGRWYGEVNSLGPETAPIIAEAFKKLVAECAPKPR